MGHPVYINLHWIQQRFVLGSRIKMSIFLFWNFFAWQCLLEGSLELYSSLTLRWILTRHEKTKILSCRFPWNGWISRGLKELLTKFQVLHTCITSFYWQLLFNFHYLLSVAKIRDFLVILIAAVGHKNIINSIIFEEFVHRADRL